MNHLARTLEACRGAFLALGAFSACVNLLMLTAPLFMLQVFDRVLASRSTDTLLALSLIAGAALLTLAALEAVRGLALVNVGSWLDARLGRPALQASVALGLSGDRGTSGGAGNPVGAAGLRDLATFRAYLTGPSVLPVMDAPWTPLFLGVTFLLHPLLGWVAVAGAIVLLALAIANEKLTRDLLQRAGEAQASAQRQAEAAVRHADLLLSMGMADNVGARWSAANDAALDAQASANQRSSYISAASKLVRLGLQIGMLALGAWLVIGNELTPGGMIAATILLGRALAPVDQAIGSWRALVGARDAYRRLSALLRESVEESETLPLPRPAGTLECEDLTYLHAGAAEPTLRSVAFKLPAGKSLGIVGPTAAGKSTLARLLTGILRPRLGHVRLDGMDIAEWDPADRGRYVGYLPQDAKLFAGTVHENIARFGSGDAEAVIAAARLAGAHDLVMRLPQGYETEVGEDGAALAGGQRQRIALARALYGEPPLVVLDEPNANLDQSGQEALLATLRVLAGRGITVVIVAHQPAMLQTVDYLLVLQEGAVKLSGPREQVLARLTGATTATGAAPAVAGPTPVPRTSPAASAAMQAARTGPAESEPAPAPRPAPAVRRG